MKHSMQYTGKSGDVEHRHCNFDEFLLADFGTEQSGMAITVFSALARLGRDPWKEAEMLSILPRSAAADLLARDIEAVAGTLSSCSDAKSIAGRLVDLLPSNRGDMAVHSTGTWKHHALRGKVPSVRPTFLVH
jgi:hypothetical protein